LGLRQGSNR